jgi:RNA polymerase sigma-70 factor (ECF subfamily)
MPVDTHAPKVEPRSASSPKELVDTYFMDVYSICFRILGRPQDAEDAAQETFLALFRTPDKLAAAASARAWVTAIARNTAISMIRSRRPAVPLPEAAAAPGPIREPVDRERLHLALAGLSEDDRHLVQMRFLEGRSPNEMAVASGRTSGSVATALCRALGRLRRIYHGRRDEPS